MRFLSFATFIFQVLLGLSILTHSIKADKIVHVVPHTHDDLGWIMTIQEYYDQRVKNILDSAMISLADNDERTFNYVEMGFFTMWYKDQSETTKTTLKRYVKEGRFEFIMGGYTMHDESASHYQHAIDQMRIGNQFLWNEFQYKSKTAWFIDPFGHSASNAVILREMGFEQIVFVRIDEKEKRIRRAEKTLEFHWTPYKDLASVSDSSAAETTIFTHVTHDHYCVGEFGELIDDEENNFTEKELNERVTKFVEMINDTTKDFLHDHMIFYFGCDFTHQKPLANFRDMEKFMNKINNNPEYKIKLFYSTPSNYFNSIFEQMKGMAKEFPKYENNDFFPYADDDYSYWTGYFTSRSNLKVKVREAGKALEASSHLLADKMLKEKKTNSSITNFSDYVSRIFSLREKLGDCQHHDSVAGTAKDYVSVDYEAMLMKNKDNVTDNVIAKLIQNNTSDNDLKACVQGYSNSDCEEIFTQFNSEGLATIDVYTPYDSLLARILLTTSKIELLNENKEPHINDIICQPSHESTQKFPCKMFFNIEITPPLATKRFYLRKTETENDLKFKKVELKELENLSNSFKLNGVNFSINHSEYLGYDGRSCETKGSGLNNDGAYIFSTQTYQPNILKYTDVYQVEKGKLIEYQISYDYGSSYLHVRKLFQTQNFLEVESIISPYGRSSGVNKLLHIKSDIKNNVKLGENNSQPEFWTDSNALKLMRRIKDFRRSWNYKVTEPVAANFYPTNFEISIRERVNGNNYEDNDYSTLDTKDRVLSVFNERPQSSGAMNEGEIMLLIDRSSTRDDSRGVDEPLYESSSATKFFRLNHYIYAGLNNNIEIYKHIHAIPIFFNNKNNVSLMEQSELKKMITNNECELNAQILTENKFFLQIMNRKDPYHYGKNTECTFQFNELENLSLSVKEMPKHGAWFNNTDSVEHNLTVLPNLKFLEDVKVKGETLKSQEFKLYLVELTN